jgi:hypothetical protein
MWRNLGPDHRAQPAAGFVLPAVPAAGNVIEWLDAARMKEHSKIRRLLISLLLVAGSFALVPGGTAQATNFCGTTDWCTDSWWQHFNDTGLVGQLVINCDGSRSQWGTETQYETVSQGPCQA